jgi:hypothetical protein
MVIKIQVTRKKKSFWGVVEKPTTIVVVIERMYNLVKFLTVNGSMLVAYLGNYCGLPKLSIKIRALANINYNLFLNFESLHISDFDQIMVCKKGIKDGYKVAMSP